MAMAKEQPLTSQLKSHGSQLQLLLKPLAPSVEHITISPAPGGCDLRVPYFTVA